MDLGGHKYSVHSTTKIVYFIIFNIEDYTPYCTSDPAEFKLYKLVLHICFLIYETSMQTDIFQS